MPFLCEWKLPGKVLYGRVGPDLTIEEVGELTRAVVMMIEEDGDPPIYFFVDMSALRRAPFQLTQLRRVTGDAQAPFIGCYIIIVTNPIYGFVAAAFVKLLHRPIRIVSSYDEAVLILNDFDPELAASLTV
jgi:hypothetical protein